MKGQIVKSKRLQYDTVYKKIYHVMKLYPTLWEFSPWLKR